ncbi:MAG TPA: porin family protein [Bacteroidota bacterium]
MKRLSAALVLVAIFAGLSYSQIGLGIKGGVNFANVSGADAAPNSKTRTGFAAGAYLEISLPMLFTIQPEILYSQKGFVADENFFGTPVKVTGKLDYLEIPVLVKYSFPVPVVKPSLYAGPALGILLSAKAKAEANGQSAETDIKDQTTSTDFGIVFGASANIAIITVDVRYTLGLTSLDKNGSGKAYNRVFGIMVGIPLM